MEKGGVPLLYQRGRGKSMTYYYLNEDKTYRPCHLMEWANQIEDMHKNDTKHVAHDVVEGFRVSTVWLGMDHNWLGIGGKPHLFETMIFAENNPSWNEEFMWRYATYDEALRGHQIAIDLIKKGFSNAEEDMPKLLEAPILG